MCYCQILFRNVYVIANLFRKLVLFPTFSIFSTKYYLNGPIYYYNECLLILIASNNIISQTLLPIIMNKIIYLKFYFQLFCFSAQILCLFLILSQFWIFVVKCILDCLLNNFKIAHY
jgi:hypothetical protein